MLSHQRFRDVMARLAAGVVVVSARAGDEYRGLTASSLVPIASEPPMVLVVLQRDSATRSAIVESEAFNVSALTRSQEFIADRLAGRAPALDPQWSSLPHRLGANGIPLVEGAIAWLECKLVQIHRAGDHDICVGAVEVATSGSGNPLIAWDRAYWTLK
jgi:flavin reductase (DIM6/NTAB) family NADH-FMN oxidoreductase RutF